MIFYEPWLQSLCSKLPERIQFSRKDMDNDYGFGKMIYDDVGFHLFGEHYMSRKNQQNSNSNSANFLQSLPLDLSRGRIRKKKRFFACSKRFSKPGFSDTFGVVFNPDIFFGHPILVGEISQL